MAIQKRKRSRKALVLAKKRQRLSSRSFLDLPAELRNRIYALALTATGDLYMRSAPGMSRAKQKPRLIEHGIEGQEFNHIKFVNRQLYAETAGLEVQFNCFVFDSAKPRASMSQCVQFLKSCTPNRLRWLRHVVIDEKPKKDNDMGYWLRLNMKMIMDLFSLCATNPDLYVHLRIPGWTDSIPFEPLRLIHGGKLLEMVFRGNDLTDIAPESGLETSEMYKNWVVGILDKHRDTVQVLGRDVSNLRFFPKLKELDEDRFRSEALEWWNHYADDPQLLPPDGVDNWVKHVRLWMAKGV
jgi:hypothetical protein